MLAVGQEKLGIADDNLIRAMEAFGGGLGANGEVCGALIGALAVVGLRYGRAHDNEDLNHDMFRHTMAMVTRFRNEVGNGSIHCRDIAGVDWKNPEDVKAFREGKGLSNCRDLVINGVELVADFIEKTQP